MQSIIRNDFNWDWLHDSVVKEFLLEANDDGRSLKIFVNCSKDSDYAPWQGENLILIFHDISAMSQIMWGVRGKETIDSVHTHLSTSFREKTMVARRIGSDSKNLEIQIVFHSGSQFEILCEQVKVEVESKNSK